MRTILTLFLGLVAVSSAPASIIYVFNSTTAVAGGFDWKYTAVLSGDQKIDSSLFSSFASIFDFVGVSSATSTALVAGLTLTTTLENLTSPEPFLQNVPDSATVRNVRTNISGAFTGTGVDTAIYTVDVIAASGNTGGLVFEAAQAIKNSPGAAGNNTQTGNTAQIPGAAAATAGTPEPATMALSGVALMGLGLAVRKRKTASLK